VRHDDHWKEGRQEVQKFRERHVLALVLAALLGEVIAFVLLLPFGVANAAIGASVAGALCICLTGALFVFDEFDGTRCI
jgi:uncharacterized membrane protein YjjB (DUF3815 family)